jgi:acetate kinase
MADTDNLILALNSGSSSLKFGVFRQGDKDEEPTLTGSAEGIGRPNGTLHIRATNGTVLVSRESILESQPDALRTLADTLQQHLQGRVVAVGHRIVHGGPHLREHQRITPAVLETLQASVHFAPLHIPPALQLVKQAQDTFLHAIHFACFDTAFHQTMPDVAARLALPERYFQQGVMRYGFHGLSYESLLHQMDDDVPERMIMAHLGNGSSLVAVRNGRSIDTSMGLSPTGGIPMGTRTGDLDPGVLLYLLRNDSMDADTLEQLVNKQSGLAGYSGGESDMQALLQRRAQGDAAATLAFDAYCTAIRKYIGAYTALLGGVDRLVFAGGIGEHSADVRDAVCADLQFLGLSSDTIHVMKAEEEVQIARHCRQMLSRA